MAVTTLRDRIGFWTAQGYRVVSETATSAQLVRPRRFSPAEFVAMPIYLLEYLGQRDRNVYVAVDEAGNITETGSGLERSRYRRLQDQPAGVRLVTAITGLVVGTVVLFLLTRLL